MTLIDKPQPLSPVKVKCAKCGTEFEPRCQSSACHRGVRHYPICRVSEWQPPLAAPAGKPKRRASFQSDFMLLWDETQPKAGEKQR
jgi:hypothetical protein